MAQDSTSANVPAAIAGRRRSGQPSPTSVSWSMTTNAAPASGSVAGKVGTGPVASKSPRTSNPPAIAWPRPVRTTAPTAISAVSAQPDH